MMFESIIESMEYSMYDVRGRDLGIERTRGGRECARKMFEMGARSGQRDARLCSEGRVQEAESESGKESGKV
jgi:hypothetical protein